MGTLSSRLPLGTPAGPLGLPSRSLRVFHLALQPTTLCNLDCEYCYLPLRSQRGLMDPQITARVAGALARMGTPIRLVWHAGEPLACGIEHFRQLLLPFHDLTVTGLVAHSIQTNATLLDGRWCQLFKEHEFEVGVSLDGPPALSTRRVDWSGRQAFGRALRGITHLQDANIPFALIAVVGNASLAHAAEIYEFACDLGCFCLGINVEETEGPHRSEVTDRDGVLRFWRDLYRAWRRNPAIQIRELSRSLRLLRHLSHHGHPPLDFGEHELFPSVNVSGDVVLLSPELVDNAPELAIGNVLTEDLDAILDRGAAASYVNDYQRGLEACRLTCPYFAVCGGGSAGNRYFERGRFDVTETSCCRNRVQYLTDALLATLEEESHEGDNSSAREEPGEAHRLGH